MVGAETARILVIQTAFLGDVVLTTPLFRALRRLHPGAKLAALVTAQAAPLIEEDPNLDEVLTYDKQGGETFASALGKIRQGSYSLLLTPHRSHRSALLGLFSGIPMRVGFADAGFSRLYHRRVARPLALHEVDRNLALLRGIDAEPIPEDRQLQVGYTEAEREEVEGILAVAGVDPGRPLAALAPGSVWATKRWSAEGFAGVGRNLVARGFGVVVLGGPDDREVARAVAAGVGDGAIDVAGRTRLKTLAAWMDRIALLVTNDSGPLHVAAARKTPTVAVFGATTRGLGFYPFHDRARVVEVDIPCRPCGLHGGNACPARHFRCMEDISPTEVTAACDEVLAEGAL